MEEGVNVKKYEGKVGILKEESQLENPYTINYEEETIKVLKARESCTLSKGDMIIVFEDYNGLSRVAGYSTKYPFLRGTLSSDLIDFDEKRFKDGNQKLVENAKTFDDTKEESTGEYSGIVKVIEEKENWAKVLRTNYKESTWVKKEDLDCISDCGTYDLIDLEIIK